MRSIVLLLSLVSIVNFYSSDAIANDVDVSSAVKSYTYKDGQPYGLSEIYQVNAPEAGFPPYYIFMKLSVKNAYPFVFNREGVPGKNEPYSRCNVALKINEQYFIPDRKYKSGYAEDSQSCLGVERFRVVKGNGYIKWYVVDVLYQSESGTPEKNVEIYFYSEGHFCFSQDLSLKVAVNKIKINDLKKLSLDEIGFEECEKQTTEIIL